MKRRIALVGALAALSLTAPAAQAANLQLGILDGVFSTDARGPWLQRAVDSGAGLARVDVGWPAASAPADGANPNDPAYNFTNSDATVKATAAAGLEILANFTGAPTWAEGPNREPDAPTGSWRPNVAALEAYGRALGTRYNGTFPDPAQPGATLPRVRAFQLWNEPNLRKYLSPQWDGDQPVAPAYYRQMLNAFYRGIKATSPNALVVTAGTGPFGDPGTGGNRLMPARFVRELLCVNDRLRPTDCADPAQFDVLSHHPYSVGAPSRKALNADDVSIPDMGKLTKILRASEDGGRRHRVWVTEVSYDSSPPDPDGVPASRHAGYVAQTLYLLSRAGVDTVVWYQVRDQPPEPSYAASSQSGLYTLDGQAKPAQRAFRLPFYARRATRGRVELWGRAPVDGQVAIQRRVGNGWRTVKTVRGRAGRTFTTTLNAAGTVSFRIRQSGTTSIAWRVR